MAAYRGSNIGILDARGTSQVLHSLSTKFSAVEFADFCTIAEEVVLRDRILLVGKIDRLPRPLWLAIKPLLDEGVMYAPNVRFRIAELPAEPRQLQATKNAIGSGLTTTSIEDASYEASRVLGAEAHFGLSATPLLRHMQHFGLVRRPAFEHSVWDLPYQYRSLSDRAEELRRRFRGFSSFPQVSIPPIALRAIQRSKTFEQIVPEVLQIREQLRPLRDQMKEIEDRLRSGQLSPADANCLEKEWQRRWECTAEKLGSTNRLSFAKTTSPLLKSGLGIVKGILNQDYLDLAATAAAWVGPGLQAFESLQLRPIHRSVANYLGTSDQEMLRAIVRIFETDFIRLDRDMHALANEARNPWRLAVGEAQAQTSYRRPSTLVA